MGLGYACMLGGFGEELAGSAPRLVLILGGTKKNLEGGFNLILNFIF